MKSTLTHSERALKIAGLMLYWGEGARRGKSTVDFDNSDPKMVQVFLRCLRVVYGITESRLRVLLYCYGNQSVSGLIAFWSQLTTIPPSQFSQPYVRRDFRPDKAGKMPHGLVHIRYSDQRLLQLILEDITHLSNQLSK